MSLWQADVAQGDAQLGKSITLSWPSLHLSVKLEVTELVPEERLVFSIGASRLTLEVEPGQIRLVHDGLRSEDEEDGMRSAWRTSLGLLAHGITRHRGHDRQVRWITRSMRTSPAMSHLFFTEAAALAQWLTRKGAVGLEGTELNLELLGGQPLTGEVLANTPDRDVAFTWREQNESCVVLRSFPSPAAPDERLIALSWSRWDAKPYPSETLSQLEQSIELLARTMSRRGDA
jgi:uncharacterized protein YndB with AHSA1/START domain